VRTQAPRPAFAFTAIPFREGTPYAILTPAYETNFTNGSDPVLEQFGRAGFLLIFALAFPLIPILASVLFGLLKIRPKRPDPIKSATYECGVETEGDAWGQFNVRYYVFALLFVVFDVEAVFLYPWAVAFRQLGLFAFVEAVLFIAILVVGYVYAWRKQALEWL